MILNGSASKTSQKMRNNAGSKFWLPWPCLFMINFNKTCQHSVLFVDGFLCDFLFAETGVCE